MKSSPFKSLKHEAAAIEQRIGQWRRQCDHPKKLLRMSLLIAEGRQKLSEIRVILHHNKLLGRNL